MLTLLATAGTSLAACVAVLIATRCTTPITADEAKVMWAMHRKTAHCRGHKWRPIKRSKDRIIGFQCECGYKFTQKRPLLSRPMKRGAEDAERLALYSFNS